MSLRDALDSWPEPEGSFDEVLEQSAQRVFHDGAAHPVEPAPGVSVVSDLRKALEQLAANLRHDAASHGTDVRHPRVVLENRAADVERLLAAGVFREPPTRDQITEAVSAAWLDPQAGSGAVVDAVLALIGDDAK